MEDENDGEIDLLADVKRRDARNRSKDITSLPEIEGKHGSKKRSADREKSIVEGIRAELGTMFVREVDGNAVAHWHEGLTKKKGLSEGTGVRHFNVMHHMMAKASTIWSKETGIERNPADQIELKRPDDARDRYLSEDELQRLNVALDAKRLRKGTKDLVIDDNRIFPPRAGAEGTRRRLEGSFEDLLRRAKIKDFRFHDLRHTFASWYMMNGGDLYELAKILGHSSIKMTERYAKLGKQHIARTGNTAREIWKWMAAS